ncbi:MAG: biopolymer transporter ExbD [Verrucomicrobiae bacterium]|nr:biopolymer transporter ExbD [Verrucomicrobiae bacterium]
MKRHSQHGCYNAVADINIVPLMDLVFNLLIVFMLTTPLLESSIDVKLPQAPSGAPVEPKNLTTLNLDPAGRIFLDKKSISLDEVEKLARSQVQIDKQHAVLVRGDEKVPYGRFVEVVDRLKKAGVSKLGIVGLAGQEESKPHGR